MSKKMNVAIVGVGVVGIEILRILKQRNFPVNTIRFFARSSRNIEVDGQGYQVEAVADENFDNIDIALFAGTEGEKGASVLYAKKFVDKGAVVIDNGSDFRLVDSVPLVVPEVNAKTIALHQGIIANPNCTTIQALVALNPIFKNFGLEKIVLTSFQATSGAGKLAMCGLWEEVKEIVRSNEGKEFDYINKKISGQPKEFSHQIAFNVIPQIGGFDQNGYTSEEMKVVHETHKIFNDPTIKVSATCVRVPVFTSHSESIYFVPKKKVSLAQLRELLKKAQGVKYSDNEFALPIDVEGTDPVFVSRLRIDSAENNAFWMWCVADNLRKGAALNAVQIAEAYSQSL